MLLEGIRGCGIVVVVGRERARSCGARTGAKGRVGREREGGRGATTRAKRTGGRRGEDDCTGLEGRLRGVAKVVLWILVHASIVGDGGGVERTVYHHFGVTTGGWEVVGGRSECIVVDHGRVAEPGLAVEGSSVEVCIAASAPATDEPNGEEGDGCNTSKSGGSVSSDCADVGAVVGVGGARGKIRGRG